MNLIGWLSQGSAGQGPVPLGAGRKHFEEAGRRCRLGFHDAVQVLLKGLMKERRGDV